MASDILIEQLTSFSPTDAERIRALAKKLGHNYKPLTDKDLQDMLDSSNIYLFVARSEGTIAGMITIIVYRIPYVKKAYLDDLIVDETYRGHGIGSQLLQKALDSAKELGASYVDFTSRPRREESNSLYEKFGFKKRDTNVYRLIYSYDEV